MDLLRKIHSKALKEGIAAMQMDNSLSDIELEVNGKVFLCHKSVLAAMSPYFRAMFSSGMKESQQARIKLEDVHEGSMEKFLNFVYTGKVETIHEDATELIRLAALFQVDCLQHHCENILLSELCNDNCLDFYRFGCMYNCPTLQQKARVSILEVFPTIWPMDMFDKLTLDELISIIRDDKLVLTDEETVCEAALKWINAEYSERHSLAYTIFRNIRLPHVSPEYLVNKLSKLECLMQSPDCRNLLYEAMHYHLLPARRLDSSNGRMRYRREDDLEEVLLVITQTDNKNGFHYDGYLCLWAFSFQKHRWFTLASTPPAESPGTKFAICSHGYDIYLSGGTINPKSMLRFESGRNTWVVCSGQLKKGRSSHSMVSVSNSLYCLGGQGGLASLVATVEEYSLPSQQWKTVGELRHPVYSAAAAVCSERILVFGGIDKHGEQTSVVQSFHMRLKSIEVVSNLPFSPERPISVTIGDAVYVMSTGHRGNSIVKLRSDLGFEDVGFDLETDNNVVGVSHHNEHLILLMQSIGFQQEFAGIMKINRTTSKAEYFVEQGKRIDKAVLACHRTYISQQFLYHTFCQ